jgi:uncharacterized protein (TIGR02147 family)
LPDIETMLLNTNSYKTFLAEELARRKRTNPQYSQRAFAKQLGLSPGELSEILTHKRSLSLKSALRISKSLGLNATETKHLIHLVQIEKTKALHPDGLDEMSVPGGQQLSLDLFRIVADWYCFAILNLTETHDFKWNVGWIARRLKISVAEARAAVERLERVGLIVLKNGKRRVAHDHVITSSTTPSDAIRSYHRQILKKAIDALDFQSVEERDITGITLAVDPKNLAAIKKDISDFQDQLMTKYSKGKKSEVYHFETALIKLTEGEDNGNPSK